MAYAPEMARAIVGLRKAGKSLYEIAAELGLARATLYNWLGHGGDAVGDVQAATIERLGLRTDALPAGHELSWGAIAGDTPWPR